jgi:hypothetical protein
VTPADAEAAVDQVQESLMGDAPEGFLGLVLGHEPLAQALVAFRAAAVDALVECSDPGEVRRRLAPFKTDVIAAIPEGGPAFRVEKLLAVAVDALTPQPPPG